MKTGLLTMIACMAISIAAFAQPRQGKEKIQALKIAFITDRLSLSPEEAKVFWPVYDKFHDEMQELRKKMRASANMESADLTILTDQEAEKLIAEMLAFKQSEVDLIKKYNAEFKKVLPVKKVVLLYKAEQEFKHRVMENLKNRPKK